MSTRTSTPATPAPRFTVVPAVSPIHDAAALQPLLDRYLAPMRALGAGGAGAPVIFVATGGTERIVLERCGLVPGEPVILVAHPGHNSLPASMEVLARIQQTGGRGRIVYLRGPDDAEGLEALAQAVHDRAVRERLHASRIGLVGEPSDWLVASRPGGDLVREVWGPTVVPLSLEQLLAPLTADVAAAGERVAEDFRAGAATIVEPAAADLAASGSVLALLRRMVDDARLDAVTVRCFDLVVQRHRTGCLALAQLNDDGVIAGCEGDLVTTVAMLWLHAFTGAVPWMANPSRVDRGRGTLLLAHCTIPRRAAGAYRLRSHFESGLGAAIEGEIAPGPVTLVRLGGARMDVLRAIDGEVLGATGHADLCRTQAEIAIGGEAIDDLLARPLGNHMVLVPGHHAARLERWHATMIR